MTIMVDVLDLNDWRLVYGDTALPFGTYRTGFPLTSQVDIGDATGRTDDSEHPNADGNVFGIDTASGRTLTFEVAVPKIPARLLVGDPQPWHASLDALDVFTSAWAARSVRRRAGAVAELYNDDRSRMVYGRPRNLKPKLTYTRRGWSDLVCAFVTSDDLFYSAEERSADIGAGVSSPAAFTFPLVFPWAGLEESQQQDYAYNAGSEATWPVVTFRGPSSGATVALLNDTGGVAWSLQLAGALAYDETAVIDTRPWARGVTINGSNARGLGMLRGDALNDCQIPPGLHALRYTATDATATSSVTINYRDAYSSL